MKVTILTRRKKGVEKRAWKAKALRKKTFDVFDDLSEGYVAGA